MCANIEDIKLNLGLSISLSVARCIYSNKIPRK